MNQNILAICKKFLAVNNTAKLKIRKLNRFSINTGKIDQQNISL